MHKLLRLLIITGLIITGSAHALFRLDLNTVDPKPAPSELTDQAEAQIDPVDNLHERLVAEIQQAKQALADLPENQLTRESVNLARINKHLDIAIEQAKKANIDHHYEMTHGVPHTGDPVDFEHARLMEELKKAEQHIHALGYVSMQQRSDITKYILAAEAIAVDADQGHHEETARNG